MTTMKVGAYAKARTTMPSPGGAAEAAIAETAMLRWPSIQECIAGVARHAATAASRTAAKAPKALGPAASGEIHGASCWRRNEDQQEWWPRRTRQHRTSFGKSPSLPWMVAGAPVLPSVETGRLRPRPWAPPGRARSAARRFESRSAIRRAPRRSPWRQRHCRRPSTAGLAARLDRDERGSSPSAPPTAAAMIVAGPGRPSARWWRPAGRCRRDDERRGGAEAAPTTMLAPLARRGRRRRGVARLLPPTAGSRWARLSPAAGHRAREDPARLAARHTSAALEALKKMVTVRIFLRGLPDPVRARRHLEALHARPAQRVHHRVHQRGHRAGDAGFADALCSERIELRSVPDARGA